jgi:hypothetical protein
MFFKKPDFNTTLHNAQKNMQKHAHKIAANNGVVLDYSEDSILALDKMLPAITQEFRDASHTTDDDLTHDDGAKGIAEALGCYIAECAERKQGKGEWLEADPETSEPRYGLKLPSGAVIFPIDWVLKKLINPSQYSIHDSYKQYV